MNNEKLLEQANAKNLELIIEINKKDDEIERYRNAINEKAIIISNAINYIDRRDIEWGSEEHKHLLEILNGDDKKVRW